MESLRAASQIAFFGLFFVCRTRAVRHEKRISVSECDCIYILYFFYDWTYNLDWIYIGKLYFRFGIWYYLQFRLDLYWRSFLLVWKSLEIRMDPKPKWKFLNVFIISLTIQYIYNHTIYTMYVQCIYNIYHSIYLCVHEYIQMSSCILNIYICIHIFKYT